MVMRLNPGWLRRGAQLWLLAGLACVFVAPGPGRAEDDIVVEEPSAVVQKDAVVLDAKNAAAVRQNFVAQYENMVFQHHALGRRRGRHGQVPANRVVPREWMERFMALWIGRIEASCEVTEPQRVRLKEVLWVDLEPVVTQIEADITRYGALRLEGRDTDVREASQRMQEDAIRVRDMLSRVVAADSLFFKVLSTTLTAEQHERLMADFAASRAGRWAGAVAGSLDMLDGMLGLTAKQHAGLEKLLLERQPMLYVSPPQAESIHVCFALVSIELASVEEAALKDIVNDRQWTVLEGLRRNGAALRPHYVKQGWYEP